MTYKSKAEVAFETKKANALADRDWPRLARVFNQYGQYLELIDYSVPLTKNEVMSAAFASADLLDNKEN